MWFDPVLLFATALTAGALLAVEPWPVLLAALGIGVLVVPHISWRLVLVCGVGFLLAGLRAGGALAAFDAEHTQAVLELGPPQRCALWGAVDVSPTVSEGRPLYTVEVRRADCESGQIQPGARVRLAGGPLDLARGDELEVIADLAPVELLHNLDLGDPRPRAARRRAVLSGTALHAAIEARSMAPTAWIDRARAFVRVRIEASFSRDAVPMARALVLGENDLDPEDDAAFKKSGLSHMLAVSGTHLVFAVVSLVKALEALLVRVRRLSASRDVGRYAAAFGIALALFYADFAGGSGSAWRAAWMLSALFLARAVGRRACPSRSLSASLLIGWTFDGLIAFDISFLLSLSATAGLLLLGKPLSASCERFQSRPVRFAAQSIATTCAAMVPCAPLLVLLGSELTLAGVFANVIAAPLGETVALPLCLTHALISPWPALEQGVALVASGALLVVKQIAHKSASASFLALALPEPNGFQLALVAVFGAALMIGKARSEGTPAFRTFWAVAATGALLVVEFAARLAGAPSGSLVMTAFAVGQGDSTLIDFPNRAVMLVDAGGVMAGADPGERVVVPSLRARRRARLDVVVLSHPHPDHFGGLLAVVRSVEIGEIWDTGHSSAYGAGPVYAEFRREVAARGIPIISPRELCGAPRNFGSARVTVLAPCPGPHPGYSANDNSFVMKVTHGERSLLLMGDAEHDAEAELVRRHPDALAADVLKTGHHGSRTSTTPELLAHVKPRIATVSCGIRNRFGHPTPVVSERLARAGTVMLRSDRDGAIRIRTDGHALAVEVATRTALYPAERRSGAERQVFAETRTSASGD